MDSDPKTPLLDRVKTPEDLRKLEESELPQLAAELRQETIDAVSVTGGHLGAGLGVVELTVALHWVFDTPRDRLVWDVGHQTYPHKIITGRRDRIRTLRAPGGLSGFTRRVESEYDPFGAAHSSTSISAGLGMAVARDLAKRDNNVVCVIGDGAMSAGMAYEAMNNAGARDERLIVVLNDNDMSIAPPTGALSAYLARISSSGTYLYLRDIAKQLARQLPKSWERRAARVEEYTRHLWQGGAWFEELGFYYVGPIDGHNFDHLLPVLKNVRDARQGPILVHVVTKKGKGYAPAEASDDKYHGVGKFNVVTGAQDISKPKAPSYTRVFAEALIAEAKKDDKIVAITAAMPDGTGLDRFAKQFPERTFDVAYLTCLPNFVVMAAADAAELVDMVATAAAIDDRPSAFRYPRGEGFGVPLPAEGTPLEIGKGRVLREGTAVALLSFGPRARECLKAADQLATFGLSATVADARFAKPLDEDLIRRLAQNHEVLVTVEEGSIGGFGSHVLRFLADSGLLDRGLKVRTMVLPDKFIEHGKPDAMYEQAGLTANGIVTTVLGALGREALASRA